MGDVLSYVGVGLFVVFFFGMCVFVHELGHFFVAKWRGLHIVAFSIGFKKIWGFTYQGVDYRIGCIPFGGYVDIPQIDATGEAKTPAGDPLPPAKPFDRILTAFAGPLCNIIFGFALGTIIWLHGIPQDTPKMRELVVASVDESSPEFNSGLRKGDVITKINGRRFYGTWNDIVRKIMFTVGEVTLDVRRGDESLLFSYQPAENPNVVPNEKIGYPFFLPKLPVVLYPKKGSPAEKAGVQRGDKVLAVNGQKLTNVKELEQIIANSDGKVLSFEIERNGKIASVDVTPIVSRTEYRVGVMYSLALPIKVGEVVKDSPAAAAGLKAGDVILSIDGKRFEDPAGFGQSIRQSEGNPLKLLVERDGKELDLTLTAKPDKIYMIGAMYAFYNYPTPWHQFVSVIDMSFKTLRGIFSQKSTIKARHLSGPLGIVRVISIAVYRGSFIQGLHFIVLITFSLAILNLLPIPVLDGGHILLALIEIAIGRPLPAKLVQPVVVFCLVLLVSFMLLVTYYDMQRTFGDFIPSSKEPPATSGQKAQPKDVKNNSPSLSREKTISAATKMGEVKESGVPISKEAADSSISGK